MTPPRGSIEPWTRIADAVRRELIRLGTPESAIPGHLEAARRERTRIAGGGVAAPTERAGTLLAQRVVLADCAATTALHITRMLKIRRVPPDRQDDTAQTTIFVVLENDLMDDFEPSSSPTLSAPPPEDGVGRALERHREAVARYLTGIAWRLWANDAAKEQRQQKLRATYYAATTVNPDDTELHLAQVLDWVHANLKAIDRAVFIGCVFEDRPVAVVAAEVAITPKAAEGRLQRARQQLREWLDENPRPALLALPLVAGQDDFDALLRRLAEYARRRGEPTPDELRRARAQIERGLSDGPRPAPAPTRYLSHAASGAIGVASAALGFVAAMLLFTPPPAPPSSAPVRAVVPVPSPAPVPQAAPSVPEVAPIVAAAVPVAAVVPAPPSAAPPAPAQPTRRPDSALDRENSLLATAQTALAANPPDVLAARSALAEHARRFPHGQLVELRDFLRVQTLRLAGSPAEVEAAERSFRDTYRGSIYLRRLGPAT
jgi:hypothetical protein